MVLLRKNPTQIWMMTGGTARTCRKPPCFQPRPRYWNCPVGFVKVAGGRQAMQRSCLGGPRNWEGEF